MSISVVVACKEESARTLLSLDLKKHDINFVGSSGLDSKLHRLITIYKPEVILIYTFGRCRGDYFNCVLDIRKYNKESKILILDTTPNDYDSHMFFRCGVNAITFTYDDIYKVILDTAILRYKNSLSPYYSGKLPRIESKNNYENIGRSVILYYASNKDLIHNTTGTIDFKYKLPFKNGSFKDKCSIEKQKELLKYLISERHLPQNPDTLPDYLDIFPEEFMKVWTSKQINDGKRRFLFNINEKLVKKVKNLRKNDQKTPILSRNSKKLGNFHYDSDATKEVFRSRLNTKKD